MLAVIANFLILFPINKDVFSSISYYMLFCTYLSLITLIALETENLSYYNIDRGTLGVALIFGLFRISRKGMEGEVFYQIATFVITLPLIYISIKNWQKIPSLNIGWALIGLLTCLLIPALIWLDSLDIRKYAQQTFSYSLELEIFRGIVENLSFTTIREEVLMRGLLLGYLKTRGWEENKGLMLQFFVFWLLHFWQIFYYPLSFLVGLPIVILILTLLVKYSKQIFPSLIFHTMLNSLDSILGVIFTRQ